MSKLFPVLCAGVAMALAAPFAAPVQAGDITGAIQTYAVQKGDSLSAVARRFDVGAVELQAANPAIPWPRLKAGDTLTIPARHILPEAARSGIVVNLAEMRLFHFNRDGSVDTFPISVGRQGKDTPQGTTSIVLKRKDPTWVVPASIRAEDPTLPAAVPPGPKNPLGQYALNLGWPGYAIHGTNAPSSIGKPVSHGCMRMYPEDIARLFEAVEVGVPVTVVDRVYSLGRGDDGHLYLQVVPDRDQAVQMTRYRTPAPADPNAAKFVPLQLDLAWAVLHGDDVDMAAVNAAITRHDGVPVDITRK